jgi:hypothetical protein
MEDVPTLGTAKFLWFTAAAFPWLEGLPAVSANIFLRIFGGLVIFFFDRAGQPIIFWSPVGGKARGASTFWRVVPGRRKVSQFAENAFPINGAV